MVEESEGADGENVTDYTARLREIFPSDITIGMLHGKMKPKEKNGIMEQFVLNGFMNPFILLAGVLLYPTMLNEISDGGDNGKISNSSNS